MLHEVISPLIACVTATLKRFSSTDVRDMQAIDVALVLAPSSQIAVWKLSLLAHLNWT